MSHEIPANISTMSYFHFLTDFWTPRHLLSNCSPPLFLLSGHSKAWELGHMVQGRATMHKDEGDEETSGGLEA